MRVKGDSKTGRDLTVPEQQEQVLRDEPGSSHSRVVTRQIHGDEEAKSARQSQGQQDTGPGTAQPGGLGQGLSLSAAPKWRGRGHSQGWWQLSASSQNIGSQTQGAARPVTALQDLTITLDRSALIWNETFYRSMKSIWFDWPVSFSLFLKTGLFKNLSKNSCEELT